MKKKILNLSEEELVSFYNNYVKKYILIDSYAEISSELMSNFEMSRNSSNLMEKINYCIDVKNNSLIISVITTTYKDFKYEIGTLNINDNSFIISIPKKYIRRNYYNSIVDVFGTDKTLKNINFNYRYLEKLPDWIISKNQWISLITASNKIVIQDLNVFLEPYNKIIINKHNFETKINYDIKLHEVNNMITEYISSIYSLKFRVFLNKKISEKYTMKLFNKEFNKLNKREIKLLEIENY